jgi:hypothetical protein
MLAISRASSLNVEPAWARGPGTALDLDDEFPGNLEWPVWRPTGERADTDCTGPDGWNVDVLFEALLGHEASR